MRRFDPDGSRGRAGGPAAAEPGDVLRRVVGWFIAPPPERPAGPDERASALASAPTSRAPTTPAPPSAPTSRAPATHAPPSAPRPSAPAAARGVLDGPQPPAGPVGAAGLGSCPSEPQRGHRVSRKRRRVPAARGGRPVPTPSPWSLDPLEGGPGGEPHHAVQRRRRPAQRETPPATPPRDDAARATACGPRVLVLGAPDDVPPVARAIAGQLAARHGLGVGVVASFGAGAGAGAGADGGSIARDAGVADEAAPLPADLSRGPARSRAARLAAALAAGGHPSRATGRLVEVALGADGARAVTALDALPAGCGGVPLVVAVSGPRGPEWDRLLPQQDLILLASGPQVPELLATVALAGSRGLAPDVPARAVAVRGGRRRRPTREGIAAALAALEGG